MGAARIGNVRGEAVGGVADARSPKRADGSAGPVRISLQPNPSYPDRRGCVPDHSIDSGSGAGGAPVNGCVRSPDGRHRQALEEERWILPSMRHARNCVTR